ITTIGVDFGSTCQRKQVPRIVESGAMNTETGAMYGKKSQKQVPSASTTSVSCTPSTLPSLPSEDLKALGQRAAELLSDMSGLDVTEEDVATMVRKWAKKFGAENVIPMVERCRHREKGFGGILDKSTLPRYLDRETKGLHESVADERKVAEADERINPEVAEKQAALAKQEE